MANNEYQDEVKIKLKQENCTKENVLEDKIQAFFNKPNELDANANKKRLEISDFLNSKYRPYTDKDVQKDDNCDKILKNNNFLYFTLKDDNVRYLSLFDIRNIIEKCSIKLKNIDNYQKHVLKDILKAIRISIEDDKDKDANEDKDKKDIDSFKFTYQKAKNHDNIIISFFLDDKDSIAAEKNEIQDRIKIRVELYKIDDGNTYPDLTIPKNFERYVKKTNNNHKNHYNLKIFKEHQTYSNNIDFQKYKDEINDLKAEINNIKEKVNSCDGNDFVSSVIRKPLEDLFKQKIKGFKKHFPGKIDEFHEYSKKVNNNNLNLSHISEENEENDTSDLTLTLDKDVEKYENLGYKDYEEKDEDELNEIKKKVLKYFHNPYFFYKPDYTRFKDQIKTNPKRIILYKILAKIYYEKQRISINYNDDERHSKRLTNSLEFLNLYFADNQNASDNDTIDLQKLLKIVKEKKEQKEKDLMENNVEEQNNDDYHINNA